MPLEPVALPLELLLPVDPPDPVVPLDPLVPFDPLEPEDPVVPVDPVADVEGLHCSTLHGTASNLSPVIPTLLSGLITA